MKTILILTLLACASSIGLSDEKATAVEANSPNVEFPILPPSVTLKEIRAMVAEAGKDFKVSGGLDGNEGWKGRQRLARGRYKITHTPNSGDEFMGRFRTHFARSIEAAGGVTGENFNRQFDGASFHVDYSIESRIGFLSASSFEIDSSKSVIAIVWYEHNLPEGESFWFEKPKRNFDQLRSSEQGGADQPATAPKSMPESSRNSKPESEGRSQ